MMLEGDSSKVLFWSAATCIHLSTKHTMYNVFMLCLASDRFSTGDVGIDWSDMYIHISYDIKVYNTRSVLM